MSVVNVKKMWSASSGDRDTSGRSITEGWTVLFDTPSSATAYAAGTASGIPVRGESHPDDQYLRAQRRRVRALSPFLYQVEWTYGLPASTRLHTDGQDPLDQPVKYVRRTVSTQEVIDRDAEGNVIANVNGDRFDPPIMDDVYDTALSLTKNYATFSEATATEYSGAINSDEFLGNPAGTCKIVGINAERIDLGTLVYWQVAVEIAVRTPKVTGELAADVWKKRVLNQGKRYRKSTLPGGGYELGDIVIDGLAVSEPVLLTSSGQHEKNPANAVWLRFRSPHNKLLPFAALNLV